MFCGIFKKWSGAQIRIHLTKESEGSTHVKACIQVPPEITQFYREIRDAYIVGCQQKSSKAVASLRKEMADNPVECNPPSSSPRTPHSDSSQERCRPASPTQPTIRQGFVSEPIWMRY